MSKLRCRPAGWRPRRADGAVLARRQSAGDVLLLRKISLFILVRPSTDWPKPTHLVEGNLLYSKFSK